MSDLSNVQAGKYEIVALFWDEPLSKPGEAYNWKRHHRGAIVDLDVETARRLVQAGAVVEPGSVQRQRLAAAEAEYQAALAALHAVTPAEVLADDEQDAQTSQEPTVNEILAGVGTDVEKATTALAAEQAREGGPRSTLTGPLEAIVGPQVTRGSSTAEWVAYATHPARGDKVMTTEAAAAMSRNDLADVFMPRDPA